MLLPPRPPEPPHKLRTGSHCLYSPRGSPSTIQISNIDTSFQPLEWFTGTQDTTFLFEWPFGIARERGSGGDVALHSVIKIFTNLVLIIFCSDHHTLNHRTSVLLHLLSAQRRLCLCPRGCKERCDIPDWTDHSNRYVLTIRPPPKETTSNHDTQSYIEATLLLRHSTGSADRRRS